jgi:hypothetical protein
MMQLMGVLFGVLCSTLISALVAANSTPVAEVYGRC